MEKKQSSIDILMKSILESDVELYISMQESGEFEQIKAMHKEEIEKAWLNGMYGSQIVPFAENRFKPQAEQYYNETFGGNNE